MYNKFRVAKREDRTVNGIVFASKKESKRYIRLMEMQESGEIRDLELQPAFKIRVKRQHICEYRADFKYKRGRRTVIEDVKGFQTSVYKIKKKLMNAVHGIEIHEV
jgi:hypothetical protein